MNNDTIQTQSEPILFDSKEEKINQLLNTESKQLDDYELEKLAKLLVSIFYEFNQ